MNLSNRIAKLEVTAKVKGPEKCACPNNCEMYRQDLTEDAETDDPVDGDGNPYVPGARMCDRCGKEIGRQVIFLQIVDSSTPKDLLKPDAQTATFNITA